MNLKLGLVALVAAITMTSSAMAAGCRTMGFRYFPAQNDSVSTTSLMDARGCIHRFGSFSTMQMTSHTVAMRPGHGTLTPIGALQFRYMPRAGYKGADRYAVRICGRGNEGSGCSTITYNVTIE
jgi:hypothetical protein